MQGIENRRIKHGRGRKTEDINSERTKRGRQQKRGRDVKGNRKQ